MPEFSALITYTHKNGHFLHILNIEAKNAKRAARKASRTAGRMHKIHGTFILTLWEGDTFLFCRRVVACLASKKRATQAGTEDARHALQSRQNRLEQR